MTAQIQQQIHQRDLACFEMHTAVPSIFKSTFKPRQKGDPFERHVRDALHLSRSAESEPDRSRQLKSGFV